MSVCPVHAVGNELLGRLHVEHALAVGQHLHSSAQQHMNLSLNTTCKGKIERNSERSTHVKRSFSEETRTQTDHKLEALACELSVGTDGLVVILPLRVAVIVRREIRLAARELNLGAGQMGDLRAVTSNG